MTSGPEAIRAKVEARKAELQRLASVEAERIQVERKRKSEAAKRVAEERLAELEQAAAIKAAAIQEAPAKPSATSPATTFEDDDLNRADTSPLEPNVMDEGLVEGELDKLIKSKANERWTGSENLTFLLALVGGFIFLLIHWPLGLGSIGFSMLYAYSKQRHYSGLVRQELGLPSFLDRR